MLERTERQKAPLCKVSSRVHPSRMHPRHTGPRGYTLKTPDIHMPCANYADTYDAYEYWTRTRYDDMEDEHFY